MKRFLLLLFFSFYGDYCNSQTAVTAIAPGTATFTPGQIYRINAKMTVNGVDNSNNCSPANQFVVYAKSRIQIVNVAADGTVKFILTQGYNGTDSNVARINHQFCIDGSALQGLINAILKPQLTLDYGLLAIPFKFQYKSSVVHPGGSLGGFIGGRIGNAKRSDRGLSIVGFGGLSSIPQNNDVPTISASDIKVVPGVGVGAGAVFNVQSFQVGVLTGWDFYNNDGKKRNSWLSFSIGFTFLKPSE
jgi:hypothetical protein